MKKYIYILLLLPFYFFSQSSGKEDRILSKKTTGFIETNFNKTVINAYENRAEDKLNEFYNYLILFQNAKTTDLQNELKQNIKQFLLNDNLRFQNFLNSKSEKLSIDEVLNQILDQNIKFKMPKILRNASLNQNDFEFQFVLIVKVNNETIVFNLVQKVYLFPAEKQFGNTKKTVWELKLGEYNAIQ